MGLAPAVLDDAAMTAVVGITVRSGEELEEEGGAGG